jgi:hypothetical protein
MAGLRLRRDLTKDQPRSHLFPCFFGFRCCFLDRGAFPPELGLHYRLGHGQLRVGQGCLGQDGLQRPVLRLPVLGGTRLYTDGLTASFLTESAAFH